MLRLRNLPPGRTQTVATITGGCHCGAIRYECSAQPVATVNCYCTDCARTSGGPFTSNMIVPASGFRLTSGKLKFHETGADSGARVQRGFCADCGTPIASSSSAMPEVWSVRLISLDDPSAFKPVASIYTAGAPPWAPIADDIPRFPEMPG